MRSVTKCVCKQVTFAELHVMVKEKGYTAIEQLMDEKICCSGCGMCRPYVKKMLVTGETEFRPGDYHIPND